VTAILVEGVGLLFLGERDRGDSLLPLILRFRDGEGLLLYFFPARDRRGDRESGDEEL